SRMRARFGVSVSSPIKDQVLLLEVLPVAVAATRMAPKLRASRSQLHTKPRPLPGPPCSASTSGPAREAAAAAGFIGVGENRGVLVGRSGQPRRQRLVVAPRRIGEEFADRRQ